jgi:hypothetical protein
VSVPFPTTRNDTAITPDRYSECQLDPEEWVLSRPPFFLSKDAGRIARATAVGIGFSTSFSFSAKMLLLPGPAWTIAPLQMDPSTILTSSDGPAVPATGFDLATGTQSLDYWRVPSDLPGITPGSLITSLATGALQRRPATTDTSGYNHELTADLLLLSKPVTGVDTLPMLRTAASKTNYPQAGGFPANTGFRLVFSMPASVMMGPSDILTFYWGGPTTVTPNTKAGGQFAAHLFTSGHADLWEYTETGWQQRLRFRWAGGGFVGATVHAIDILPYGPDRIAMWVTSTDAGGAVYSNALPIHSPLPINPQLVSYQDNGVATGYTSRTTMTGAGKVRLDVRQDFRGRVWVYPLKYPTDGYLLDEAFSIHPRTPGASKLQVSADVFNLQDTAVTPELHDGDAGSTLTDNGDGSWGTLANQAKYYARWHFRASTDQFNAPVLYGERFIVDGQREHRTPTPKIGGLIQRYSITGTDVDPSHETAFIEIEDPKAELSLLSKRARVHFKLTTRYDPSDPTKKSVLTEGEITHAPAELKGVAGYHEGANGNGVLRQWPSAFWRKYECTCVGMWSRLEDQYFVGNLALAADLSIPKVNGKYLGWKVTDALRQLFYWAGFPDEQIDLPNLTLRFSAGLNQQDAVISTGLRVLDAVRHFSLDYLGQFICWDGNARAVGAQVQGMWRLLPNPQPPWSNVLCEFRFGPAVPGRLATHPNSYGRQWADATHLGPCRTFVRKGTYRDYPTPPEFNSLQVTQDGVLMPGNGGATRTLKHWVNDKSFNPDPLAPTADPLSADYLGRFVPRVHLDQLLAEDLMVAVGNRICAVAGHGQRWARFQAPLVLVWDTTDPSQVAPRPLRINDVVTVEGVKALVRSCNISVDRDQGGDACQWTTVEVIYTST